MTSVTPSATPGVEWLVEASGAGHVGLWRLDIASGEIECTERCKQNLGFDPGARLHVDDIFRAMHPDDREAAGAIVSNAIETRGEYHVVYRVIWPDGSTHWIDSRGRVGDGVITGTTIDISEQREVEERLLRESTIIRTIATQVAEPLFFMDARGSLTFMNRAAEETFGWTEEELRGRTLHDAVHYKCPDGTPFPMNECPLGQTLFGGIPIRNREDLWVHRSGAFVPVLCSAMPILENGAIRGAVISAHDISDRKAIEDALRESSRAKDEFLATVSHELRTPMTAVLGWIGYIRMCGFPEELQTAVEQIESSAKAQAAIVDDLVDVSRIVTGKLRLHTATVDLADVLDDALRTIGPTAEAKQITMTLQNSAGTVLVHGDRSRIRQVLWNLLTNAIKFTPARGAVSVSLDVHHHRAVLAVCDTGIGIAPEFLPRVFDRFAQETTSTRYHGGLGLGLSIVKQLVEMHDGHVTAASEGPGRGATFTVTLPVIGS